MRHKVAGRKLARTSAHRLAMRRNLVQSLFEHSEIRTTLVRAKEVRRFAEKLITLAMQGSLAARQRAEALLTDRSVIPAEYREQYDRLSDAKRAKARMSRSGRRYRAQTTRPGVEFTAESIVNRLFSTVAAQMKRRNEALGSAGGYTRIIKLSDRRLGDGGELAILQLVKESDKRRQKSAAKTERKRRARVRYAYYAGKGLPQGRRAARAGKAAGTEQPAAESTETSAGNASGGESAAPPA